jgi:uncharacterized protein YoxC
MSPIKKDEEQKTKYGVNVAVPNTIEEKMKAIQTVADALFELSKAINGVNIQANINNNVISAAEIGIYIGHQNE